MRIDGNTLAKYLVMVSQVIAWCTVSMMLLRRGLNQVHDVVQPQQPRQQQQQQQQQQQVPSHDRAHQRSAVSGDHGDNVTVTAAVAMSTEAGAGVTTVTISHQGSGKPFDGGGGGTPAVVAGIVMIAIAAIMLIVSPVLMLMKFIEKRKKRILDSELESPPKYEDVVESAPRYSSLFVFNTDGEMTLLSENIHKDKDTI